MANDNTLFTKQKQEEIDKLLIQVMQTPTGDDVMAFDVTDDITDVTPTTSTYVAPSDEGVDRTRHLAANTDKQKKG